ncbi:MAG TPA: sulfotransferase [Chthoniobacteraceae bacterium]|nr:sulfotransferase [Chthoniobacteraceae bacterium]
MKRTIHFIAGLPRSGSTLLCNLLAQNQRIQTTSTSGIINIVNLVHDEWKNIFGTVNHPAAAADRKRVIEGVMQDYFDEPGDDHGIVFDKSRGWLGQLWLAELALGRKAKVLVCVRDIRDVLASFEQLWRKNAGTWGQPQEQGYYLDWQTVEGRCDVLMRQDQVVGGAYHRIKTALSRGARDRMHFVEFEKMTANPRETIRAIYDFLGEPLFDHNFENVEQVTWEDDYMHGIPGLHKIRQKIEPVKPNWPRLLGNFANKYAPLNNLWRHAIDGYYMSTALSPQEQQSMLQGMTGPGLSAPV